MAALGLPAGPLRKPLRTLADEPLERGLAIIDALGLGQSYGYARRRAA